MARKLVSDQECAAALQLLREQDPLGDTSKMTPAQVRDSVRTTLRWFAQVNSGHTIEVRVPPHAAVQAVAGPRHTRGTPPNVIEMSPRVWLDLAMGTVSWSQALAEGQVSASGIRADLTGLLPLKVNL